MKYLRERCSVEEKRELPQVVRLVVPKARGEIGEGLVNAVLTAAVYSVEQKPGTWRKMITALYCGAEKTAKGTVNEFLFNAMVDCLLEEYRTLLHRPSKNGQ